MKISVRYDILDVPTSSNNMEITLQKKTTFGYEDLGTTTYTYPKNSTVTSYFNTQNTGSYRFYFSTLGYPTSGGSASYVQMGNF